MTSSLELSSDQDHMKREENDTDEIQALLVERNPPNENSFTSTNMDSSRSEIKKTRRVIWSLQLCTLLLIAYLLFDWLLPYDHVDIKNPTNPTSTSGIISLTYFHTSKFGGAENIAHSIGIQSFLSKISQGPSSGNHVTGMTSRAISIDFQNQKDISQKDFQLLTSSSVSASASSWVPSIHQQIQFYQGLYDVTSLTFSQMVNWFAHYVHDEHRSPYSSFLYDNMSKEELDQEQVMYQEKMNQVRQEWGAWNICPVTDHPDPEEHSKSILQLNELFQKTRYRDISNTDFFPSSWQRNEDYIKNTFLPEASALIDRVLEGIYSEYGHPTTSEMKRNETLFALRNELFQLILVDEYSQRPIINYKAGWTTPTKGVAWMSRKAYSALIQKLLHAMITNDVFYVVLGGHSSAAGHGNNFFQNQVIQFHYIMEPILDKLGIKLITRNLAMGGLGTLHFTLGQSTLYGEKDFLWWDSSMTETGAGDKNLFIKQALLGGERVPIIMINDIQNLTAETDDNFWYGDFLPGTGLLPITQDEEQVLTLPWAVRYLTCDSQRQDLCKDGKNVYNSECWLPRWDVPNITNTKQMAAVGGQASWHPGNRYHQYQARKLTLIFLYALRDALVIWKRSIEEDGFPLSEKYWHVGGMYNKTKSLLQQSIQSSNSSVCHQRFPAFPRVCQVAMRGIAEHNPRNMGYLNSIRAHIKPAPDGWYTPFDEFIPEEEYHGLDLLSPKWKIPDGHVDLHAIAIATSCQAPSFDYDWMEESTVNVVNKTSNPPLRRWLKENFQQFSHHVFIENKKMSPPKANKDPTRNTFSFRKNHSGRKVEGSVQSNQDESIVPGRGWFIHDGTSGLCDGSSNSFCGRKKGFNCLMSGHNDNRGVISTDGLSGWLIVRLPNITEGLIIARVLDYFRVDNPITKTWSQVNDGAHFNEKLSVYATNETNVPKIDGLHRLIKNYPRSDDRILGGYVAPHPDDISFDIAIDGKIVKSFNKTDLSTIGGTSGAYNQPIYVFLDDPTYRMPQGQSFTELAMRTRSETNPRAAQLAISHIYFA